MTGGVLAVVEHREGRLTGPGAEVVAAAAALARTMGCEVGTLLIGGPEIQGEVDRLGSLGATHVHLAIDPALTGWHPEALGGLAASFIRGAQYDLVLWAATAQGREIAARVAGLLERPLVEEVIEIRGAAGALQLDRPLYSGKAIATVEVEGSPTLVTFRPGTLPLLEGAAGGTPTVERIALDGLDFSGWWTELLSHEGGGSDLLDVAEAAIVVSGGRGLRGPEGWGILEELRAALGPEAALGASRAVVDAGWRPHGEQVGQTGKSVTPRLYFAIGISGAVQHLAGMRTARTIVAVNRDREAPIFRVADYGIVGDAFEVVPQLTEAIRALREG